MSLDRWYHLPKGRRPTTEALVLVASNGEQLHFPSALVDALGGPNRVHLYRNEIPGELWIVPADDQDDTAYSLYKPSGAPHSNYRRVTVGGIYERLGLWEPEGAGQGSWYVEEDRVIVRFEGEIKE